MVPGVSWHHTARRRPTWAALKVDPASHPVACLSGSSQHGNTAARVVDNVSRAAAAAAAEVVVTRASTASGRSKKQGHRYIWTVVQCPCQYAMLTMQFMSGTSAASMTTWWMSPWSCSRLDAHAHDLPVCKRTTNTWPQHTHGILLVKSGFT